MKRPFQSLSVKLTLVFFITALIYIYGLSVGIRYLIDEDELREIIGYYQTSYYDYMLADLQYPPNIGKAEIIVAKQRNGPIGSTAVTFIDRFVKFENLSTMPEEPF